MLLHYGARDLSALAPTAAPAPPTSSNPEKDPNYIFGLDFLPTSEAKPPSPSTEEITLPKVATPSPTAKPTPAATPAAIPKATPAATPTATPKATTPSSKTPTPSATPASKTPPTPSKDKSKAPAPAPSASKTAAAKDDSTSTTDTPKPDNTPNVNSTDMRFGVDFLPAGEGGGSGQEGADSVPLEQVVAPIITKRKDLELDGEAASGPALAPRARSQRTQPQGPAPSQQWWEPPRAAAAPSGILVGGMLEPPRSRVCQSCASGVIFRLQCFI
jgi:hypothetical protein